MMMNINNLRAETVSAVSRDLILISPEALGNQNGPCLTKVIP